MLTELIYQKKKNIISLQILHSLLGNNHVMSGHDVCSKGPIIIHKTIRKSWAEIMGQKGAECMWQKSETDCN